MHDSLIMDTVKHQIKYFHKFNSFPAKFLYTHKAYVNLYGLFILDVNIKYIVFSILYRHINVPVACKELNDNWQCRFSNE